MNAKYKTQWDYDGWRVGETNPSSFYTPQDWNQTILTKFNMMSAQIYQASSVGGANKLTCNSKVLELIKTLEYFYPDDFSIAKRFKINIDDSILENKVYIYRLDKNNEPSEELTGEVTILNYD